MYCAKNIEELNKDNENYQTFEYELQVDSQFVGEFSHNPYEILLWEYGIRIVIYQASIFSKDL